MKLPVFDVKGKLPEGIHICSGQEFLDKFCKSKKREQYTKPICDILDYAKNRNAVHIFVGGSFVTSSETPNDIDCVIVFEEDKYIPSHTERVNISGLRFDILYASLETSYLVDCYIKLFSSGRYGEHVGLIQIDLYGENKTWEIRHQPDDDAFEIIKRVYNDRSLIDFNAKEGILVSIHGLLSRAKWNMDIAPIASNQGWIVAPYFYDSNSPDILFNKSKREDIVNNFREWIFDLHRRFETNNISIIAHSFGTYIVGSYLTGFDENEYPPVSFNGLILTGSILSTEFDWDKYRGVSIGSIYNMVAPNDEWVKYMPGNALKKLMGMSPLFGKSGVEGFAKKSSVMSQSVNSIFNHTNTIKRDVIETKWMPFLTANKNSMWREYTERMIKEKESRDKETI